MIAGLIQLGCQIRQFLGMGSIVAHHILHQGGQFLHGGVLVAVAAAAVALVAMVMAMLVVMLVMMAMTVVVIVAVTANVIVIQMHKNSSLGIVFYYYTEDKSVCQNIYFHGNIPPAGLRTGGKWGIMDRKIRNEVSPMPDQTEHDHAYLHSHGMDHSHGHVHENQKAVVNRLARAIGHMEKVKRMVEEGYDCSEVLVQLAAVRSAIDNTGKVILQDHMRHCMVDAVSAGDESAIEDLCRAIEKYMK